MDKKLRLLFGLILILSLHSCNLFRVNKSDFYENVVTNEDDLNAIYNFIYNTKLVEDFRSDLKWVQIEQLPDSIQKKCKKLNISNIRINGETSKKIEDHLMGNSIVLMTEYTPFIGAQRMIIKYYSGPAPISPIERDKYISRKISDNIFYVEIW